MKLDDKKVGVVIGRRNRILRADEFSVKDGIVTLRKMPRKNTKITIIYDYTATQYHTNGEKHFQQ